MTIFESVSEGVYLEGLSIDYPRDLIWYSDVVAGGVHGVKTDGSKVAVFNEGRQWTGGVMMNRDGSVLSTGEGGIMWNHLESGKSGWLLREIDGKPINGINEMWPDGKGGIFFGTIDMESVIKAEATRPTAIYRLAVDGKVSQLDADIFFSNGIGYDPDLRRFYCCDSFNKVWTWDVDPDFSLSNRRVLIEKDDADGLALDVEGNVWVTGFGTNKTIIRLRPDGTELEPFTTPQGCTTQLRFGGKDMCDVYLTVVPADAGERLKEGKPLSGNSCLYRGRSEIPGVGLQPANFTLI